MAWHQDGTTHRGAAEKPGDPNSHGCNSQTLLYGAMQGAGADVMLPSPRLLCTEIGKSLMKCTGRVV